MYYKPYKKKRIHYRMPSTGKLVGYLVEEGGHVGAGDLYAEIEVMKMIMELRAAHSGKYVCLTFDTFVFNCGGFFATCIMHTGFITSRGLVLHWMLAPSSPPSSSTTLPKSKRFVTLQPVSFFYLCLTLRFYHKIIIFYE